MNKKGFTLVELIAVIVILAVVALIGTSSISNVRKAIDKNMLETKLQLVVSAAKKFGEDNKELFIDSRGVASKTVSKTIGDLISANALQTEEYEPSVTPCINPSTDKDGVRRCAVIVNPVDENILNSLSLTIYVENNRVYACIPLSNPNKALLNETSCTKSGCSGSTCVWNNCEYADLNFYCINY